MSEVANKDLCAELHELSGLKGDGGFYSDKNTGFIYSYPLDRGAFGLEFRFSAYGFRPLAKILPAGTGLLIMADGRYKVWFRNTEIIADTPEDAACKLAIELFKQGVLKKEAA